MFYLSNFIICKWDCFISSFQIPKSFPLYWTCLDSQEKLSCGSKCPTLSQTHGKMCSISSLSMMFAIESFFFVDILYLQFRLRKSTLYPQFFFFKWILIFIFWMNFISWYFSICWNAFGIFFSLIFVTLVFKC